MGTASLAELATAEMIDRRASATDSACFGKIPPAPVTVTPNSDAADDESVVPAVRRSAHLSRSIERAPVGARCCEARRSPILACPRRLPPERSTQAAQRER